MKAFVQFNYFYKNPIIGLLYIIILSYYSISHGLSPVFRCVNSGKCDCVTSITQSHKEAAKN